MPFGRLYLFTGYLCKMHVGRLYLFIGYLCKMHFGRLYLLTDYLIEKCHNACCNVVQVC